MQHFLFFYYLELSIKYASIVHTSDDFLNLKQKLQYPRNFVSSQSTYPSDDSKNIMYQADQTVK